MKRTLTAPVTNVLLIGAPLACLACGETAGSAEQIPVTIESQDEITSETGTLALVAGTLAVQSVSLIAEDGSVPLVGPVTIDLSVADQELPLRSSVPPGSYTGLHIELAPTTEGSNMLDVQVRSVVTEESVRAISKLTVSGDNDFPDGPRTITETSEVELNVLLRAMFFYLAPLTDAVDGVYDAGENHRDLLTMDLIGMFDLRVLP
jgi:hypothetical protein